jgi:hypothetical protein
MTTKLNLGRDVQGYPVTSLNAPQFSDTNFKVTLASGVAQSITVPSDSSTYIALFSVGTGTNVWVARNTTATIPTGTIGATLSILNPPARTVYAGDTLSFVTDSTTADFGVSLYAIGN